MSQVSEAPHVIAPPQQRPDGATCAACSLSGEIKGNIEATERPDFVKRATERARDNKVTAALLIVVSVIGNNSATSVFITGAELEIRSFRITQQIIADSGLQTTSGVGQEIPSHRLNLIRITKEPEIPPDTEKEYVFSIPPQIPYSRREELLISAGSSCALVLTWVTVDGHRRLLTELRPCKELEDNFPEHTERNHAPKE